MALQEQYSTVTIYLQFDFTIKQMIVNSSFFKKQFDVSKAELIGQGNFAQVYRVFDADLQNYLAIRRVDRDLGESEDIEKQKTINEQLRRVQNEHILKIFDIIESETCIWYITQYCEGGSLWDALNNCTDNKMNEKDSLQVVYQISKGVKQLHNHRITHRDLKPENILLKTKYVSNKPIPTIKIADFGLSTKKIIMETIAGTKQYIAPEQARFHNYTNAVDVWSLGIIFDQILHGSPFYVGDNNKEVFQKILKNPYKVRDETLRPSIQQFLVSVLKKKAYERPIIAVICQNIEKILEQIKRQRQKKQAQEVVVPQKMQKPTFEKKLRTLQTMHEQVKSPLLYLNSDQSAKQLNISLKDVVEENKFDNKSDNKSSTKRDQRKAKTPFKRQNGRPELFKPGDQVAQVPSAGLNHLHRNPKTATNRKQIQNRIINRQIVQTQQNPLRSEPSEATLLDKNVEKIEKTAEKTMQNKSVVIERNYDRPLQKSVAIQKSVTLQKPTERSNQRLLQRPESSEADKIQIYRVDKRKIQSLPSKGLQLAPNVVDIKDYMDSMMKLKSQLAQSSIVTNKDRQFIPNAQLTITQLPEKFAGEEVLKRFKKSYDFLNYVNYKPDYQMKLYIGKNTLNQQKSKAQAQMLEQKQKIKKSFLAQVQKFVDYYVHKVLK